MRFLRADYIFPVNTSPVRNGILVIEDDGTILDVLAENHELPADTAIEAHRGIICPGFVNAHCHLELSFLKGKIPQGKGLGGFIQDLLPARKVTDDQILEAAQEADAEMVANGIVMVGDISNNDLSISVKKESRIRYHTFIEIFDLKPEHAFEAFRKGKELLAKFNQAGLNASIVPHAPYSVSPKLLKLINDYAYENNALLSIHNQETEGENEMFLSGTGNFINELNKISGAYQEWSGTGFRSLASVFVHLPKCNKIQFIHNTYSSSEDIRWAHLYSLFVWWCFCPNANLYIENKLPDINMFRKEVAKITIGTDSYASNHSLSVLDELKTIQRHIKTISLEELIKWSTLNGAEFFGLHREYGSFEKGKKPGVNLICNVDMERFSLEDASYVIPLI